MGHTEKCLYKLYCTILYYTILYFSIQNCTNIPEAVCHISTFTRRYVIFTRPRIDCAGLQLVARNTHAQSDWRHRCRLNSGFTQRGYLNIVASITVVYAGFDFWCGHRTSGRDGFTDWGLFSIAGRDAGIHVVVCSFCYRCCNQIEYSKLTHVSI